MAIGIPAASEHGARAANRSFGFMAALRAKAAPASIDTIAEGPNGLVIGLTDGRSISVDRSRIEAAADDAEVAAYAGDLLAKQE